MSKIADRYAKSIFVLAKEKGMLESVYEDMAGFVQVCKNKDFTVFLKNPVIKADKKISALDAIFGGKINALTEGFIKLMVNKGRESHLSDIANAFKGQYREEKGITLLKVITAAPMSNEAIQSLVDQVKASGVVKANVEVITEVQPDIIGGVVLEFDNKVIDASVEYKLNILRRTFSENVYAKNY